MQKKSFNWKIWAKKLAINGGVVILAGLSSVYGENPYYLAIAPVLLSLQNILKHKYNVNL